MQFSRGMMTIDFLQTAVAALARLRRRLVVDTAGNTFILVAAAMLPMLALIGGGIDMGRSYLSETRLQQACDSGVLAARKAIGTTVVSTGIIPSSASMIGNRFFNTNFPSGAYGSANRAFTMTLEDDYSVSGVASADVPTTIMRVFGKTNVPVRVSCTAKLNFSNTDVMMVLDVTGSMAETNPGDSMSRIESLKSTVQGFYNQVIGSASPGVRIRFGFVPYSTNVNVGGLLQDDWVVTNWKYQSRESVVTGTSNTTTTYTRNWAYVSGSKTGDQVVRTYAGTWHATSATQGSTTVGPNEQVTTTQGQAAGGYYTCDTAAPSNTYSSSDVLLSTATEPFPGPPTGTRTIEYRRKTENGSWYWVSLSGSTCTIYQSTYNNYINTYEKVTDPATRQITQWHYFQMPKDVSNWRSESNGCIEERDTYEITDYSNVNLNQALDLDLDTVPNGSWRTQWRPAYPGLIYQRAIRWNGSGSFSTAEVTTNDEYIAPAWAGLAACPAAARKLAEMSSSDLQSYLNTLQPNGSTYHDIGMIWGGRLISPTGLFAAENADLNGNPTSRNLIFLTDGETAPLDVSYSSYGAEGIDQRRWSPSSPFTLTQTVENRFTFACNEVKKRNVTVWVIGFGTQMTDMLKNCAGDGRWFQANNAAQLSDAFSSIAKSMGDLRISK